MSEVRKKVGFALMTREEHAEVSRRGGITCHKSGKGNKFTSETGKRAAEKSHSKVKEAKT